MADPQPLLAPRAGYFSGLATLFATYNPTLMLLLCAVYFTQGLSSLSLTAAFFYYKETLGNTDAAIAQVVVPLLRASWCVKPLLAFLIDWFPGIYCHRNWYVVAAGLAGVLANLALAQGLSQSAFLLTFVVWQATQVVADIVADALTVIACRENRELGLAYMATLSMTLNSFAIMAEGLGLGFLWRYSFCTLAVLNALIAVAGLAYRDTRKRTGDVGKNWRALCATLQQRDIHRVLVFLFIVTATMPRLSLVMQFLDSSVSTMAKYCLRDRAAYGYSFFHFLHFLYGLSLVVSAPIHFRAVQRWTFRTAILCGHCALLLCAAAEYQLAFNSASQAAVVSALSLLSTTLFTSLTVLPKQVIAMRMCPVGVEATVYSFVMSSFNLASYCSDVVGSVLMSTTVGSLQGNLLWLAVAQTVLALAVLPSALLVPRDLRIVGEPLVRDHWGKL